MAFKIGIMGASGYTGAELIRLLALHPKIEIKILTGERQAGKNIGEVFSHLGGLNLPKLCRMEEVAWDKLDGVFCCLPHGNAQLVIRDLPSQLKIVDLSADYRIKDPALYEQIYGHAHVAPQLQKEAIYGLTEHYRVSVAKARIVANPGCYPTAAELPLWPLLKARLIDPNQIIIDAASGMSGAGRDPKLGTIFSEVSENFSAYGISNHRHAPEIEQELSLAAGQEIKISFTPHLVPMIRGILATIYVKMGSGVKIDDLRQTLMSAYQEESFVRIVPQPPSTKDVKGSNFCHISLHEDRREGSAIIVSAIDNLIKGASGQAIQNFNVMMGWKEHLGLQTLSFAP